MGPNVFVGACFRFSSNQLLCFVASFVFVSEALRSAVNVVAKRSLFEDLLFTDEAATTPVFFFLFLVLWPGSSVEEAEESSVCNGGGVVGFPLIFALAVAFLFLNVTITGWISVGVATFSCVSAIFRANYS